MKEVNFIRGIRQNYRKDLFPDCIYFATDTKEIIVNDISYGTVDLKIDNSLTSTSTNLVTSAGIYSGVAKQILDELAKSKYPLKLEVRAEGYNEYRLYLINSKTSEVISKSEVIIRGEQSTDLKLGGVFLNLNNSQNQQVKVGEPGKYLFYYDRRNDDGYSMATKAVVRVYKGSETIIDEFEVEADSNFNVIISDEHASVGSKTLFYVKLTPIEDGLELEEETKSVPVSLLVIDFTLVLNGYLLTNTYKIGDVINIPYSFTGYMGEKTTLIFVDGVNQDINGNILYPEQTNTQGYSFNIPTSGWSEGTHTIQLISSYKTSTNELIYSNLIYLTIPIKGTVASFGTKFDLNITSPLAMGQLPTLLVNQYLSFSFDFIAIDNNDLRVVDFYSDSSLVSDYLITSNTATVKYKYSDTGTKLCKLKCGNQEFIFNVEVLPSGYSIYTPSNPILYLTALGKHNSSNSRDVWEYGNITSTFEGFNWNNDGWISSNISNNTQEPALRLISGDKVTINYKPFEYTNNNSNAFTFMVKFKASSVSDENQVLLSCLNELGIGFEITGTEAYYKNSLGQTISTKFAPNEVYNIGFTVFLKLDLSSEQNKLRSLQMFLYVNGVMSGNVKMKDEASIYLGINPANITILASNCILDIFSIRSYNKACSESEMFASYLVDLNNLELLESEYKSNQVLDSYDNVSLEKALECGIPCVLVTGQFTDAGRNYNAVDYVAAENDKGPKYDIEEILYLENKEASERNFLVIPKPTRIAEKDFPLLRLLGTSSMNYPIKNFRIYTKNGKMFLNVGIDDLYKSISEIELLEADGIYTAKSKPKFAMRENSAPVNCFCLKADFAEASSSHNTGFAKLVHDLSMDLGNLTPPQKYKSENYKYEIRTTIDGYPCLLFSRETTTDTPVFRGKFNFNNDKSTEEVFGFIDIDGYHNANTDKMLKATDDSIEWLMDSFEYVEEITNSEGTTGYVKKSLNCSDIKQKLGNNPVECWEFLNNEHKFGLFKNVNFNSYTTKYYEDLDFYERTYDWLDCWEARFPDEDELNLAFAAGAAKPHFLETVALWLMSTDTTTVKEIPDMLQNPVTYGTKTYTTDNVEYRRAKFTNEVGLYFNINFLCEYYVLNDMVAGADQRLKNMMWAFWYDESISDDTSSPIGKVRCYPIFYDNDTILGIDNSGKITIPWDADENSRTDTSWTFAGHDSVLWINLRDCMKSTLKSTYRRIRDIANNDYIKKYFNSKQSDVYGEVIFNKDSIFKYLRSHIIGTAHKDGSNISPEHTWDSFSDYIQGTRKAHRDWFINNRLDWFDNKNAASGFISASLNFKGGIGYTPYYTIKTSKNAYYSITSDNISNIDDYHVLVTPSDNSYDYKFELGQLPGPGATYRIHGLSNASEIDLSHWAGFNSFIVGVVFNNLKKLILGNIDYAPIRTSEGISFPSAIYPQLTYLDVSNMLGSDKAYVNADLKELLYLETFIATGCSNLTTASFAPGGNISRIVLPENFKNLYLVNLPKLTKSGILWGSCVRPLWGITKDEEGNEIISKLEGTETLTASYASIQQLHVENCDKLDGMDLVNTILNTTGLNLQAIRIVGVEMSGNGNDLINLYDKKIKGLLVSNDGAYNIDPNHCYISGVYKLTTLLDVNTYNTLCDYFPELDIQQPEYTTISFSCRDNTSEKVTNYDNNTGYEFRNTYEPSGHITRILEKRHAYLVKHPRDFESGHFAAIQLDDSNSTLFTDGTEASLNGSQGDFCMYEPKYWYKGINDHKNSKLYLLYASEEPTVDHNIYKKVYTADCELKKEYAVNTSNQFTTEQQIIIANSDYNLYSYTLEDNHLYKQFRVSGVSSQSYGCVVVKKSGEIVQRLVQSSDLGMYDGSYLFDNLHPEAYKIYITLKKDFDNSQYCLLLTKSSDLEAIEPDWVEHKECFVGRVFSTMYEGAVKSAIYEITQNFGSGWTQSGFYPKASVKVKTINDTVSQLLKGYYTLDYEMFKDILNLAYARYGSTGLHCTCVGAGADLSGTLPGSGSYYIAKYFIKDSVKGINYGIEDTKTSGNYASYYGDIEDSNYPIDATLMGYYHFIGRGTMVSYNDRIYPNNRTYYNDRTKRSISLKGSSSGVIINKYVLGGRYFDIFGAGTTSASSSTAGFCGREQIPTSTSITTGLLKIGYKVDASKVYSYNLELDNTSINESTNNINYNDITNACRLLIIPDKITYYNTSSEYDQLS